MPRTRVNTRAAAANAAGHFVYRRVFFIGAPISRSWVYGAEKSAARMASQKHPVRAMTRTGHHLLRLGNDRDQSELVSA